MAVKYSKAPISELVCGIFFNSNLLLIDGIIFQFLTRTQGLFPVIQTLPTIPSDEVVNGIIQTSQDYIKAGFVTYRLFSNDMKWQVLIQQNMVTLHWVRQDDENVGNYPGYDQIFAEFKRIYIILRELIPDDNIFNANIKSLYLCYTDRINMEPYRIRGMGIDDLITLPPIQFKANNTNIKANNYFNRFSGACNDIDGYFIASINSPTIMGLGQFLIIENKVKGSLSDSRFMDDWFESAHQIQLSFFESIFKSAVLEEWK
jgi:uncharacterized protein (TIGR04255 family)